MKYDELIDALRKRAIELPERFSKNALNIDLFLKAADAIEEMQAQLMYSNDAARAIAEKVPKWIPVTERLPEEHIFVLIRQDDNRMMIAERVDGDWWYRYFAYDVDRWDENEQGTITHWMPLPEPPKEET